ncbi:MAG: TauD/TfdA family dioxygenase [Bradyrhizobium sp.]|nr:TauD/TfdA family dioxygenase [Bradyrhizobium sp.]
MPMGAALGAEVRNVDIKSFGDWQYAAFMRALLQHQVLLVRGQSLVGHDLIAFSRRLVKGLSKIAPMSTVRVSGAFSCLETPPIVSLLHAREMPPHGRSASFCSLHALHDSLPPALRRRIANLEIGHGSAIFECDGIDRHRSKPSGDWRPPHGAARPLVCHHPDTGRQMLRLGRRRNAYLLGLKPAESEALLDELWQYVEHPEFCWEHAWQAGDLVISDRRCTLQQRGPFEDSPRWAMSRTRLTERRRDTAA